MSGRKIEVETFKDWCKNQAEMSQSSTARYIGGTKDGDTYTCRLREQGATEDIKLVKGRDADVIRFEKKKQYRLNRRDVEFHRKTMIVKDKKTGKEMARAGTGTRKRRGPFPF